MCHNRRQWKERSPKQHCSQKDCNTRMTRIMIMDSKQALYINFLFCYYVHIMLLTWSKFTFGFCKLNLYLSLNLNIPKLVHSKLVHQFWKQPASTPYPGFNLMACDSYFTIPVKVFTNHTLAENTYFMNYLEWTEHVILVWKPACKYKIIYKF